MTREELMAAFDIKEPDGTSKGLAHTPSGIRIRSWIDDEGVPSSKTALVLDDWDLDKGRQLCKTIDGIDMASETFADFHGAAFLQDPQLSARCMSKHRSQYLETLLESPDFKALRVSTKHNPIASEAATWKIAEEYVKLLRDHGAKHNASGRNPLEGKAGKEPFDQFAAISAAGRATCEAQKEVDDMEEIGHALGMGGGGAGESKTSVEAIHALFTRVRNDPKLRRICELAGAYIRTGQSKQRRKTTHGYEDMVGIKLDDDLSHLLAEELCLFAEPDFETATMARFIEKECLAHDYRGIEPIAKGPLVVCVDESGSMTGEPIANAKAFALGMAFVAKAQRRHCTLVGYSGSSQGNVIELDWRSWDTEELIDWLEHFYSGGTHMDIPLEFVPKHWAEATYLKGKADLIVITDAICHIPERMITDFNKWKETNKVRLISMILEDQPGDLAKVSDETHLVSKLTINDAAVQRCLEL